MSKSGSAPTVSAFSGAAGQIISSDIQENLFILGLSYSWEDYLTYSASEEKIFVFDPTACTCAQLVFNPLVFSANAGPITIDIYTSVSWTPGTGTLAVASNRRETSPNTPEAILRYGSAATLGFSGTKFAGDLIPANGAAAPNAAGNSNPEGLPFEIDISIIKAVGLTNTDGNGILVSHKFNWFEVPAGF